MSLLFVLILAMVVTPHLCAAFTISNAQENPSYAQVVPPPPQVSGIKVFHRAGQTFITWKEVGRLLEKENVTWGRIKQVLATAENACHYKIYVHTKPIDAGTITKASLLTEVAPLSGYKVNGRNMEYLIGQAMIQSDEMGELARDYNGYMYTWGMDHPRMDRYPINRFVIEEKAGPLPPGTGLYVHSPASPGERYYAVVSCVNKMENRTAFSKDNALLHPVTETVGPGESVCQGPGLWGPYFDYPGRRQIYIQWCAPPLAPLPNMYFNWSVLMPPELKDGEKAPVELHLHAGNFSYAKPRKKFMRDSIQIAPHDYPFSGWYGFNDTFGTTKSPQDGTVRNHTQKRIIKFLEWAKKRLPVDGDRIVLCGSDGAALLAMNFRDLFAYTLVTGFGGSGKIQGRVLDPKEIDCFVSAWGPKSLDIKDERGRSNWEWAMLDKLALEKPDQSMPLIICEGKSWGGVRQYGKGYGPFYTNMQKVRQPLIAGFGWDTKLISPDWYTGLWQRRRGIDAVTLDIIRKTPILAFANSSRSVEKLQSGNVNWMHTWRDIHDKPDRFQVTVFGTGKVDITPRRLQSFQIKPSEQLRWQIRPLPDPKTREAEVPWSGLVMSDVNGLVTVADVEIPAGGVVVTITHME